MKTSRIIFVLSLALMLVMGAGIGLAQDEQKVNLNKATVEELAKVPGLDADLAEKIVQRRQDWGDFIDLTELLDIEGIDNRLLRQLKQYIFIEDVAGCNC